MRLQRMAMHRMVRLLSALLPIAILAFVGIAAWNYWSRTREVSTAQASPADPLPDQVMVRTQEFEFTRSEGGKDRFNIRAKELLGYQDNSSVLKDVDTVVFGQKPGDPDHTIHGGECRYHEKTQAVTCESNVTVGLDPGTTARTEELHYDSTAGVISSPAATTLERPGDMQGLAGRMEFFVNTGLLRLTEGADIQLATGGALRGGIAVFQRNESWATISQGVEVSSPNGAIRGGSARAELTPGTYTPRVVTVENSASAQTNSARSAFSLQSDWLQGDFSEPGNVQRVLARGNVRAENKATTADGSTDDSSNPAGVLTGPEIEAWLDESGAVSIVEARQHPEFTGRQGTLTAENTIRMDQRAGTLRTEGVSSLTGRQGTLTAENTIHMDQKGGTLRTDGVSSLTGGDLRIDGRDFSIDESKDTRVFKTSSRATLKSPGMVATGDTTTARIDNATNKVVSLVQEGRVTVDDISAKRSGSGGKLTVTGDGDRIEIEGGAPEVRDSQATLKSRRIVLDRKAQTFVGEGAVIMTDTRDPVKPLVAYAGRVEGSDTRVEYTRGVELFPEPGKGKVEADRVVAFPKERRFEAEGNVRSKAAEFHVTGGRLDFRESGTGIQSAHYTEKVIARKTDRNGEMVLESEALDVEFRKGEAESIVGSRSVRFSHGARTGTGERVEYNKITGDILLFGSESREAEVREAGEFVRGCSIEVFAKGGKAVRPCEGGSVTSSVRIKK